MAGASKDHCYSLAALQQACDDDDIDWMDQQENEEASQSQAPDTQPDRQHTPLKSLNPKKMKKTSAQEEISNSVLLNAIQSLTRKFDTQNDHIQAFEWQLKENTEAVVKIKESVDMNTSALKGIIEDVDKLKKQVVTLQKENADLHESCLEHARYKRRWSLRLNGIPEREGENTQEEVIKILTKVVPLPTEHLQNMVDVVHRLGQKVRADRPRQIILQFSMRTVRDQVWRLSKNAKICNEMKVRFREDFCKEDREAHACLWLKVEEARKRGLKAYLRDGHAVIDSRRVTV